MKIDNALISSSSLTEEELLLLLLIDKNASYDETIEKLEDKGLIKTFPNTYLTVKGKEKAAIFKEPDIDFDELAKKLQEIYPKGRKLGTNCMWRDSSAIIARKLRTLVNRYGCRFTEEDAIRVTKEYVESFNGQYDYMQVLKYFLLKNVILGDGDRETKSEFMSRLENEGQDNHIKENWDTTII